MEPGPHVDLLEAGVRQDATAYRHLFAGNPQAARDALRRAAESYRESWRLAPPRSFGRLVAMLKSAVLAGDAAGAARYARRELGDSCDSPTSCYALALACLVEGDDARAVAAAGGMRAGDAAFDRAAEAIAALARRDRSAYATAVRSIVTDFEGREHHLTGVAIADTALLMEALAESRDMAEHPQSSLLPPVGAATR